MPYRRHDPETGCGCVVLILIVLSWVFVVLALIGAIEVIRRVFP